ncbi:hypothetical protein BH10ACI3_BH10ACI3_23350 [soil metagenome]
MEKVVVKTRDPRVNALLRDLEGLNLIEIEKSPQSTKPKRRFGSMKGLVEYIADDFDAPLDDLKEYM